MEEPNHHQQPDHNNIERKFMNYLTNYYKNLSEQLQEQINQLEALIAEAKRVDPKTGKTISTREIKVTDYISDSGEEVPLVIGQYSDGKGKGAQKTKEVRMYPGRAFLDIPDSYSEFKLAQDLGSDNPSTPPSENPIHQSFMTDKSMVINPNEVWEVSGKKGGSRPGSGKKAMKKRLAINAARFNQTPTGQDTNQDGDIDGADVAQTISNIAQDPRRGWNR
jgi:hypothetical protein